MTALTLIRHGETDWNRDRRIQGSTDIPLNDTGRAQARAAAEALRGRLVPGLRVTIAASDLSRARETAEIIAAELEFAVPRIYPGLRERSYGEAEGLDVDEFRQRFGHWRSAEEVPGAEPWLALRERGVAALGVVVRDHRRATAPSPSALIVVSHGGLIREVIRHATADAYPPDGERLANGSAHEFVYERDHLRLLSYAGVIS